MKAYKGQTNEVTQVELPSAIEQVGWTRPQAAPGGTVGLQVFTRYVGNGAPVEIKLTDKQGRTHGTFKDGLYANRLGAEIQVPPKAEEALFAEVKLPKHGLSQTSSALLLTAPVAIRNVRWSQDEARRGDVLTLSADVEGAPDGMEAKITIFEHDEDGAHDRVTRFAVPIEGGAVEAEWAYEYHEDTDDIPTEEEAEQGYRSPEYFFRVEVAGVAEDSELLLFRDHLTFQLVDASIPAPYAGQDYVLHFPDGTQQKGTLDEDGIARIEEAPPGPYRIEFPGLTDSEPEDRELASTAGEVEGIDLQVAINHEAEVHVRSGAEHRVAHRRNAFTFSI